jgi:transposase-like protein
MGSLNIRNMTAEHKARVVARYREAGSVYAVRREFGHDHSTVRKICAEAGVVVKGQRRHGPLSLDEKASICLRYAAGDTLDSIIRDGAATFYTIRSVLNGAGLFIRGRTTRRGHPLSVAEQSELARRYVDGESSVDLELSFDVCKRTVLSVLKKAGVSRRDAIKVRKVVHPFGNVFLDAEDRPNAAYWLGFLMADGCVSIDRSFAGNAPRIAVTLKGDDVGHLELFRQFTGIEMPIRVVEYVTKMGFPTSRATYAFSQEEIATTAMSYGIIPAKTLVARVDDRLAWNPHFWRGMVDGDGCLYETKAGRIR